MVSSKFLTCVEYNILFQKVEDTTKESSIFDLALTNRKELLKDVEVMGNLGRSNHNMIEFIILKWENMRSAELKFQKM